MMANFHFLSVFFQFSCFVFVVVVVWWWMYFSCTIEGDIVTFFLFLINYLKSNINIRTYIDGDREFSLLPSCRCSFFFHPHS